MDLPTARRLLGLDEDLDQARDCLEGAVVRLGMVLKTDGSLTKDRRVALEYMRDVLSYSLREVTRVQFHTPEYRRSLCEAAAVAPVVVAPASPPEAKEGGGGPRWVT